MRILLVGEFATGSLESSYARAFGSLGIEVFYFFLPSSPRFFYPLNELVVRTRILGCLKKSSFDLIMVFKGNELNISTLQLMRQENKKAKIFCFLGDDPFAAENKESISKNVLKAIPYYDCYFIWANELIEPLYKAGAKQVQWLPFGFDATMHHPISLTCVEMSQYACEVVFVGNWDVERQRYLSSIIDFDLAIWGGRYWRSRCQDIRLRRCWRKKELYGEAMAKAFCASKVSLNIFRKQNKNNHNMRTFEAPACAVFVLSERSPGAMQFFEEDKEAVYFSSPEELREKLRFYLNNENKRISIAKAGYQRCLRSGYSYIERAAKILNLLKQY